MTGISSPGLKPSVVLLLLALTVVTRFVYATRMHSTSIYDVHGEMLNVSMSIAESGQFANPYSAGDTGPTAHVAPIPAYLLAAILRMTDTPEGATVLSRSVAVLAVCAQLLLLLLVGRRLGLTVAETTLAGLIFAAFPASPYAELNGIWEHPYAALATAGCALALSPRDAVRSGRGAFLRGMAIGLAFLVTPVALLFCVGFLARRLVSGRRQALSRHRLVLVGLGLCGLLLTLAPWTIRNRLALGEWFFVRDNLGLELGVSNSPIAQPTFAMNTASMRELHPNLSPEPIDLIRQIGEVGFNREMQQRAVVWAREDPIGFLALTANRASLFWLRRSGGVRTFTEAGVLVLFLAGAVLAIRRRRAGAIDLVLACLAFSGVYYLVQSDTRYSYPIQWAITLVVGVTVVALAGRRMPGKLRQTRDVQGWEDRSRPG